MRHASAARALAQQQIDALVVTDPADVTWLTGFYLAEETWPGPRDVPTAAVVTGDSITLIVPTSFAPADAVRSLEVMSYPTYDLAEKLDVPLRFATALDFVLGGSLEVGTRVGVQGAMPASAMQALQRSFELVVCAESFREPRLRKDQQEIELIRANARLCDLFQQAVAESASEGVSEIKVFTAARTRVEQAAEKRVTILGDLVSGKRCLLGGGDPTARALTQGDPLLADVAISTNGYWADNCSTVCVGRSTEEFCQVANVVREALLRSMALCRPGTRAGDVDAAARTVLGDAGLAFHHHLGHGVGASYHESPRLVPAATAVLQAGMVLCLEPAAYIGTACGVRLEVVGVVREDDFEPLSHVPIAL